MIKDETFEGWSEEDILNLAMEVCMNEHSATGVNPPVGEIDINRVAFCISQDDELDLIFLNGEDFIDDEN